MLANKGSSMIFRNMMMAQTSVRYFGVLPKLPKVELTMRTPYRTFFNNFNNFTRIYVHTQKGLIAIGNKSIPRIYLLPPGELTVKNIMPGKLSSLITSTSSTTRQISLHCETNLMIQEMETWLRTTLASSFTPVAGSSYTSKISLHFLNTLQ